MEQFDVIVLGAGLNGLVTALALGGRQCRRPLKVVVVDRGDPVVLASNPNDSRASALTHATQDMMRGLGVWDDISADLQPMLSIVVSDAKTGASRDTLLSFLFAAGEPTAAMIENVKLMKALLAEIAQSPAITIICNETVEHFKFGPGKTVVDLASGLALKADLMVGAEGRVSPSRLAAGIKMEGWDYPNSAITLTVAHELPHEGRAEEHFTAHGVFAILPLAGNRSSIVWTEPSTKAHEICNLAEDEFTAVLIKQFGHHLGQLKVVSKPTAHPLAMQLCETFTATRLALVGDAAHVVHPLAGLGLNLGLKDAAALSECVMGAALMGGDIGSDAVLDLYNQWRRFDTVSTAAMIDGLHRLFANNVEGLRLLRHMGLRIVANAGPLKTILINEAAGISGALPRLMRGLAA